MKIRALFTIIISVAVLLSAALFSSFVFFGFREEYYKLVDREILDVGEGIFKNCRNDGSGQVFYDAGAAEYPLDRYWIRLSDQQNRVVYRSPISTLTDLSIKPDSPAYFAEGKLSPDAVWIDPVDEDDRSELTADKIRFRVVTINRSVSGADLLLVIAKPIPVIAGELTELLYEIAAWTVVCVLLVIAISYVLAGRMLKPLQTINQLTREIRESSLHRRIPERKNRDELSTLTQSLNSMFDRLQHSFQRQKEFVGNASHELKSPLTILRLRLEDLLSAPLSDEVRKEIEALLETTQRIQRLVLDLLDLSRMEQQDTVRREPFDLTVLIKDVLDDYDDIISARTIAVTIPAETFMVSADREKIRRMFINLIDNAVKYNRPRHGSITVNAERQDERLSITVINTGKTIPEELIPLIFDQFVRAEKSRSQEYGGTGLGLTIVRKIAELHGGSVHARSDSAGTAITVILPLV
ncbi:MAG: HAMP domain-containing histidine kinase [Desulfofustis sp.]|nr:HAMP domain-containing histidine kinase [Desulfofustis sp.]